MLSSQNLTSQEKLLRLLCSNGDLWFFVFSSGCQYLCPHSCEVRVLFSDYYGRNNLPDTTLIVTSRGLCTITNSKKYVIFYTVNVDVLVIIQANMNFYARLRRRTAAVYLSSSSVTVGRSNTLQVAIIRFMCY